MTACDGFYAVAMQPAVSIERRWGVLAAAAVATLLISLGVGAVDISISELARILLGGGEPIARSVVLELRLPRALAAMAVGGALAVAGLLLQALFRNPLADPYVLGVSGGASVGALLALAAGGGAVAVQAGATTGAVLAGACVFLIGARLGASQLLLAGVVVASACGAAVTLLLSLVGSEQLRGMLFWLAGDLSQAREPLLPLLIAAVAALVASLAGTPLNVLAAGDLRAAAVGLDVRKWRILVFLAAAGLTAIAVVVAGTIGFVGLMGAHGARLLLSSSDHRQLAPATMLLGGTFVAIADLLARTVLEPRQLPVGAVMALLGAPLFILLLRRVSR